MDPCRPSSPKRLLAISGSLRAGSSNELLLRAASKLVPSGFELIFYRDLTRLPYFNPDLDTENPPAEVKALRAEVGVAAGLVISSPEYAHGVPGSLKNALDWLVASSEFPGKPIVLICGGEFAPVQLEETLKTMSAKVLRNIRLYGPALRNAFDSTGKLVNTDINQSIQEALGQFDKWTKMV